MVGKHTGDTIEIALVFGRKPGPVTGKRTARTTTLTERSCIREICRKLLSALAQVRYPFRRCNKPFAERPWIGAETLTTLEGSGQSCGHFHLNHLHGSGVAVGRAGSPPEANGRLMDLAVGVSQV